MHTIQKAQRRAAVALLAALIAIVPHAAARQLQSAMAYTVSMSQPSSHLFHVVLRVDGLKGEFHDFKMPAWHPGYYRLTDYARNVSNFVASAGDNKPLPWEKTTKNTWRVATGNAGTVFLRYDVFANQRFSAQNYLDEDRAFIAPTGMFLYIAGQIQRPATVTIELPANWTRIATGLDAVSRGTARTFRARDFDVLYDSPLLMGNQETLEFDVQGKRHTVALEDVPASVDRGRMIVDLRKIVETAGRLMGDVDYTHYAFLMMGRGAGGIEHSNSSANSFNGASLETPAGYLSWLSFIAHEYFHSYNVKRIRPLALGPFDYDTENVTDLLWVSEGLSVYYQDLLLVRAGLMTEQQYLDKMKNAIASFENAPGHHYQSATDSSRTTWGTSGVGNDRNTTISYYNNGAMLGAMLDLKIRYQTSNRRSLDDVMRTLYNRFYKDKQRGFTSEEFREVCESIAGGPLEEVFGYASTTKDVDYAKYFAQAGLEVRFTSNDAPGAGIGLNTQLREGKLVVAGTSIGSPAESAGLKEADVVLEVDGIPATAKALNDMLVTKSAGDTARLRISRDNAPLEIEIVLGKNSVRRYEILPLENQSALQAAIRKDWLRNSQ
jgi:predicted metalloprotease with PDZ domain